MSSRRPANREAMRRRLRHRIARRLWQRTRKTVREVYRRHWRQHVVVGGPTPFAQQCSAHCACNQHDNSGGSGHYSRPRPAPRPHTRRTSNTGGQTMGTRLSARARAMLPPECQQVVKGGDGIAAWQPDDDGPATDIQNQIASVGMAVSGFVSGLEDMLGTLTAWDVDRRIIDRFGGGIDNVTAGAEALAETARKFVELYGPQMSQESEQAVKPVRAPSARRAA